MRRVIATILSLYNINCYNSKKHKKHKYSDILAIKMNIYSNNQHLFSFFLFYFQSIYKII